MTGATAYMQRKKSETTETSQSRVMQKKINFGRKKKKKKESYEHP
jgi:hypothetical protein